MVLGRKAADTLVALLLLRGAGRVSRVGRLVGVVAQGEGMRGVPCTSVLVAQEREHGRSGLRTRCAPAIAKACSHYRVPGRIVACGGRQQTWLLALGRILEGGVLCDKVRVQDTVSVHPPCTRFVRGPAHGRGREVESVVAWFARGWSEVEFEVASSSGSRTASWCFHASHAQTECARESAISMRSAFSNPG